MTLDQAMPSQRASVVDLLAQGLRPAKPGRFNNASPNAQKLAILKNVTMKDVREDSEKTHGVSHACLPSHLHRAADDAAVIYSCTCSGRMFGAGGHGGHTKGRLDNGALRQSPCRLEPLHATRWAK